MFVKIAAVQGKIVEKLRYFHFLTNLAHRMFMKLDNHWPVFYWDRLK